MRTSTSEQRRWLPYDVRQLTPAGLQPATLTVTLVLALAQAAAYGYLPEPKN